MKKKIKTGKFAKVIEKLLTEKGRLAKFGPASLSLLSKWHVLCF
jgi:hypothetical protein